jgi:ketosteroid isomerase-like protein
VSEPERRAVIERLVSAVNRHDPDGIVELCHPDVRSEMPPHPARNSVGRDMMRANWAVIFELVPDLVAEMTRCTVDGELVWVEWLWRGTHTDGSRFERCGVAIHGIRDGQVKWVRAYMQPITSRATSDVDQTLREMGRQLPES